MPFGQNNVGISKNPHGANSGTEGSHKDENPSQNVFVHDPLVDF